MQHLVVCVIYLKDNMFQLKLGTIAQSTSFTTLLGGNRLANWHSAIKLPDAIVVVTLSDVIQKEDKNAWHKHLWVKYDPL